MDDRKAKLSRWGLVGFALMAFASAANGAAVSTTTTLSPASLTAFASAPNNVVMLMANVTGAGASGTVTFKDGAATLACAGGNPAALNSGSATCATSFATEGIHSLSASYSGDSSFLSSSATANVYIQNHATNTGTTYCNRGPISANGSSDVAYSNTSPYPSVIFVGDGVNTDIINVVNTLSLQLTNFSATNTANLHMLLVSPDGMHALDFWSNAGSRASAGNSTLADGASNLPPAPGPLSPGTYAPSDYSSTDTFAPMPPSPAPQIPATFRSASPFGTSTFEQAFIRATSHGAWSLYVWNDSGAAATVANGWCLNITPSTTPSTTTAITTTANPVSFNPPSSTASVTLTAAVSPVGVSGPVNKGVVVFTDFSTTLGISSVSNGQATLTTSLGEGTHQINGAFHDSTNDFGDSNGIIDQRVDAVTATPRAGSGAGPYTYCNVGPIQAPGPVPGLGPATPYPSNIFVSNLPGTVKAATVTLNGFSTNDQGDLLSLLVGPGGNNLDFFSLTGSSVTAAPSPINVTFSDLASNIVNENLVSSGSFRPTSFNLNDTYPQCPSNADHCANPPVGPPLPSNPFTPSNKAPISGTAILGNANAVGVFGGTISSTYNGNGTWSLYLDQRAGATGGELTNVTQGWCVNLTENLPIVSATKSHTDTFAQGQQSVPFTIDITNRGPGATGDPTGGTSPLTVTDTLNSAFTYAGFSGTAWSCSSAVQVVTCLNHSSVAQGDSYTPLTIIVNVNPTASTATPIPNVVQVTGGGATPVSSNIDTVAITAGPLLGIVKSHTGNFTQGQSGQWSLAVSNTVMGSSTLGTTTVTDSLPAGYTLASFSSTGGEWSCSGVSVLTCNSTGAIAGGSTSIITLTVNVPTNSPATVSNTAGVFGGGDMVHTSTATAATSTDTVTVNAATPAPTVVSFSVLFGSQQFNLIGSTRNRLPWQVTGIQVVFSQPIASGNMGSLTGVTTTALAGLGTNTLTWSINPVSIGSFSAALLASGPNALKNTSGNALNDGTNFNQNFKVLWADFNDDGVVSATDSVLVNTARSSPYNIFADLNGNGVVDATDVNTVRMRIGTSQP